MYKRRMGNTRDTRTRSKYSDGLIGWAKLPIRSQETLYQWEYDEADNLVGMTQMPPPDFGLLTIPMSKALLFRTKVRKDNPEGRSILRNAYRSWHFKRRIQEIEGIGIERDLAGLPVIYTPEDMDIWNSEDETISRIRVELENMVRGVRTHAVITGAASLNESLKNAVIKKALKAGCLVLSLSKSRQVWIDKAINTLTVLSADQDKGWKKIRRMKTRFELEDRVDATIENLGTSLDNDDDGRATVISAITDVEQWYSELNSMQSAGRITSAQNKQYHEMTGWYVKGQEGSELSKSLQLGSNTLNSAYAEKIQSNRQSLAENTQFSIDSAQKQLESGDTSAMTSALMYGFNELGNGKTLGITTDATQNALSTMYESMKPDVTQMQGLIDDYREAGKAVPQSLMDSFNDAIEVGAAAGDTSATWQNYANQIWKNGSDELKASLTDPSNPMYETVRSQLPPELAEAIDRAAAETTTEDVTLEGLKASVDGDVDIDKDAWTSKLNEALGDLGETQEVTADHVKIKVDQGDCLWEIGNALGIDWQTIAEQNGIESPYVIHPDQELTISMDTLTAEVDGDKAQAAIEQAMSALDAEGAEMSVTAEGVKVDLADVEVDSDTAAAQIEAALGMESGTLAANGIEVQTGATVTVPSELVQVDASGLQGATQEAVNQTDTEPVEKYNYDDVSSGRGNYINHQSCKSNRRYRGRDGR